MPVIDIDYLELKRLSGLDRPESWFCDIIPMTGATLEGTGGGILRFEFFPNRPDNYSVEGVARTLRCMFTDSTGPHHYTAEEGDGVVLVDDSVAGVRPVIVCAVIRGIHLDDAKLKSLIDLQEKLHLTVGRKRRKVAIGLHDMGGVSFPFRYAAYPADGYSFSPLGSTAQLSLGEIVATHEKGVEFGNILGDGPYPLITDARGSVLSMPPIINGNVTQVTASTTDMFVDVTGTSESACSGVLNILCAALADQGGRLESVTVSSSAGKVRTPDMSGTELTVGMKQLNDLIGVKLAPEDAVSHLRRMGYDCSTDGLSIRARAPPYRMDIMHPVDVIEDAAVSYGFANFGSSPPSSQTTGSMLPMTNFSEGISELLIGYGYSQVVTFMISGTEYQVRRMRLASAEGVKIQNPVLEEMDMLRSSLLPGMLSLLESNKHNELPQKIFEVGDVHSPGPVTHLAVMSMHPKAAFAEAKSMVDALGRDTGSEIVCRPSSDPRFIEGRQMAISISGEEIGIFGELHPEVITNFNLYNPIAAAELDLRKITKLR